MIMHFDVRYRWNGALKFRARIDCDEGASYAFKLGLAVKWGIAAGADLAGADLVGANLAGANLAGAELTGANLARASLVGAGLARANLAGADLARANLVGAGLARANLAVAELTGANLARANLVGANLARANLAGADLVGANLACANLVGAGLVGANLVGANLVDADLSSIRADFFDVLLRAIPEASGLLRELRAGNINGSTYRGSCACLVGTIANLKCVDFETLDYRDICRPIERWFTNIRPGDNPANSTVCKITEGWILEFISLIGAASSIAAVPTDTQDGEVGPKS